MKHTNSRFVVARLMLIVLTLAITVFSFASCDSLPPELQGILGGNNNSSCEHAYDNACDIECNECGATREIEHTYENGVCSICGVAESVADCQHTNVENCVCKDCNEQKHTNLVLVPGMAPTCEYKGYIDCYQCFGCGKVFLDADAKGEVDNNYTEIVIQPLGHDYVNNVCDRCGHCKHLTVENCVCKDCNKPVHLGILVDYAYIAPTCTENGRIAYLACGDCETILYDAETLAPITDPSEIIIPSLGGEHNYVNGVCDRCGDVDENAPACEHITVENCVCHTCGEAVHTLELYLPAGEATCTMPGVYVDIYYCDNCEGLYADAEGEVEITDDNLYDYVYDPLGHNYVNGKCTKCLSEKDQPTTPNPNVPKNPFLIRYKFEPSQEIEPGDEIIAYASVKLIDEDGTVIATAITDEYGYGYFEVSISSGIYTLEVETGTSTCSGKTATFQSVTITYDGTETEEDVSLNYIIE